MPMKQADWAALEYFTPTLERIIRVLEWVRVEEFVRRSLRVGRRLHPRCDLARAFCAKAIWGLQCTRDLIERLKMDRCLRSICGFARFQPLPSEAAQPKASNAPRQTPHRCNASAAKRCKRCWPTCPKAATVAARPTPVVTKKAGTATNCTWTQRTAASSSVP
jgi:hypothetical protein